MMNNVIANKEYAYKKIADLVERFTEQFDSYKRAEYNETLTRRDFVDPFFKALGWDVDNSLNHAESYREVIHEDRVKIGKATKAPDYSFRLPGGKRLFFVEAKKPSVDIKGEIQPAYQVRRYGWSAKMPISIITDFEEFAIYDCTKKPLPTDKSSVARIKYLNFQDYLKEFDFIWDTFSRERVPQGSFDKFVQGNKNKKGTATVDKEFLASLDEWRTLLATTIAKNNEVNEEEINFAVQQTLDRIIFLRIAEDRSIEDYGKLKSCLTGEGYYKNLFKLFQEADDKYNSGLFDFKKDQICPSIQIDNKVLKNVIENLYYPNSPYEFSVLSVEILGSAYEQFLGKQIKVSKSNKVTIEEKPEVRKAGGVYYTPEYIVEYIVKNTVGKLVENKSPKEVSKIKIVDPACGSGSFLIGAYQYLLDWHKNYYTEKASSLKGTKNNPLTPNGNLTTAEKKQILLNNIFGVDIDVNAVEVTKLSLLLKCMEGETQASIETQLKLFHERVLPTLDNNIKSGNSLIDTDFYDNQFDFGQDKKIKPFSWDKAFPEVFNQGGFDSIIGNPPYIQLAMFDWFDENQKKYMLEKFSSSMGRLNTFGFFIEKGIKILSSNGLLGFIIPNTILTQEYYEGIRKFILKHTKIMEIVSYDHPPFSDAVVETITLILGKGTLDKAIKSTLVSKELSYSHSYISQESFEHAYKHQFNLSLNKNSLALKNSIQRGSHVTLNQIVNINQGIALKSNRLDSLNDKKLGENYKPVLDGRDIDRYGLNWKDKYLKYDVESIHSCKRQDIFLSKEKIFFRRVSSKIVATLDTQQFYALNTLVVINLKENVPLNIRYVLGILNSKLMNFYYFNFLKSTKKVFSEIQARQLGQIPFILTNLTCNTQKQVHDDIVALVSQIILLNCEKTNSKLQTNISDIEGKIEYCEEKINKIVYQLYDLTSEEIKIVEGI